MSYIVGSIPFFRCYVRREYTCNMKTHHGEFIPAVAYGVRCVRGQSIWFQCMLMEPEGEKPNDTGGASFLVPIQAICHQPCQPPPDMRYVQYYDIFSSDFGVEVFDFVSKGAVYVLPDRVPGQYQFTIDFVGTDIAEDSSQHKHCHIVFMKGGLIGAFPNNRLLWRDDAFWKVLDQRPDFESLEGEFRAEGHQHIFAKTAIAPIREAAE